MGGGGLKLKLKIKMPGAPAAASSEPAPAPAPAPPAAAAPSAYMRPPPPQRQPLQTSASGRLRRAASAGVALLTAAEGGTPASPGHYQQQYMQQQQEAMGAGRMQRQRSKRQMGDEYVGVDELDDYIKEQRIEAEDLTEDGEAAAVSGYPPCPAETVACAVHGDDQLHGVDQELSMGHAACSLCHVSWSPIVRGLYDTAYLARGFL